MDKEKIAYLAGLFDADGIITYKQYYRSHKKNSNKKYWTWYVRMELSMINEEVVRYIHEILGVGTVRKRPPHKTSLLIIDNSILIYQVQYFLLEFFLWER